MPDTMLHIVEPTSAHTHTIILLHGRGSSATEFASEFLESQASDDRFLTQIFPGYKWVFPCAAIRYAQSEEEDMHQWFDTVSVQNPCHDPESIQLPGMRESVSLISDIVEREAAEIGGLDKVFLGGISQGCATAISALLTVQQQIAGFIGFSGWCPFSKVVSDILSGDSDNMRALLTWLQERRHPSRVAGAPLEVSEITSSLLTPVLLQHAKDDGVVPVALGQDLRNKLAVLGTDVQWRAYEEGGHWINEPNGIDDMINFINSSAKK
ncbi:hypothetical protein HBI56_157020 [Parastagonospora nodorum]|nr:hypothetical protein HBH52_185510 [Parastagonospora nodorum]KAH4045250.1 hypothetical protein HBH49_201410 [Parastagonospora nodorum]KAH4077105.1 hypothetical protein HBH46_244520 [Parastagonospora nodorum]KAH4184826.1 hypothetical protein HBH42_188150 [Parastagonospora nodorum]KAH4254421.1 hypothetical protein HBI03_184700 [Parastagonospora nodorum]